MSRTQGYITLGTAGVVAFNLGLPSAPTWAIFTVCEKNSADSAAHLSAGKALDDSGTIKQHCMSTFTDSMARHSFNSSSKVVQHYERVSGTVTKVLSASLVSFTANGIELDVDTNNVNYKVLVEAGD